MYSKEQLIEIADSMDAEWLENEIMVTEEIYDDYSQQDDDKGMDRCSWFLGILHERLAKLGGGSCWGC